MQQCLKRTVLSATAACTGWGWEETAAPDPADATADGSAQPHFRGLARRLSNFAPRSEQDLPEATNAQRSLTQCTRDFGWSPTGNYANANKDTSQSSTCDSSESDNEFCRICREGNSREGLIAPCDCRGTVRFVHKSCLERWLGESDTNFCEICGIRYVTERTPRYGLLKSVLLWAMTARQDLLIDLLTFLTFMPLAVLGTTMGVSASRSLCYGLISEPDDEGVSSLVLLVEPHVGPIAAQVCSVLACVGAQTMTAAMVAVMAAMDIAVSAWLVLRIQQHTARYYAWWRRHCLVRLVLPPQPPPPLQLANFEVEDTSPRVSEHRSVSAAPEDSHPPEEAPAPEPSVPQGRVPSSRKTRRFRGT